MKATQRNILRIAIPSIVSNITVPLLGLIDVTIVGHLGDVAYIGAIAVGGMIFNMIYWLFGFLRMGTSGLTSQAYGRHDFHEVVHSFLRSLWVSMMIALVLLALQRPLLTAALFFIDATPEVKAASTLYYNICIWGAPAILGLYSFMGWYIGMQNSRLPMWIAIVQNVVNIVASLTFVYGFGMKIEGVAMGTLIAQWAGLIMAGILWIRYYGRLTRFVRRHAVLDRQAMKAFFGVNRDIFLRTLCLIAVTVYFTSAGAAQGNVILAVNTLLLQLFTLFSYIMDGFAYAAEALTGRFVGANNRKELHETAHALFRWGVGVALVFTLLYALLGHRFLGLLTDDFSVLVAAKPYMIWAVLIPMTGMMAFLYDGFFIGATATHYMLVGIGVATAGFFLFYFALRGVWGNHALWFAFIMYLSLRGGVQMALGRKLIPIKTLFQ